MRYSLRNSSPSDPGILVHDGGFILAGSRADAERLVYDNQQLCEACKESLEALRDLLIAPGLNADDLPETEEIIKNARDLLNDKLIGNSLDSQFDQF